MPIFKRNQMEKTDVKEKKADSKINSRKEYAYIVTLSKIEFCGSKWCHFHGRNADDGTDFECSGKLWYMGDCLRNSSLDISHWDNGGFLDVIAVMVARKIRVGWNRLDGWNLYPEELPYKEDVEELRKVLQDLQKTSLENLQLNISSSDIIEES